MAKSTFKSVDDYIAAQSGAVSHILSRIRSTLRKALPGAEEVISYGIPAYKVNGKTVIYFAAFKEHYSIFPGNAELVAELGDELAAYQRSKGTIRFPLEKPVPVKLIEKIARIRAKQIGGKS